MPIPRLIMQTWKTKELPTQWQTSQDSIACYMPDWTYVLMTDTMNREFIAEYFPDFLSHFDNFPYPIQRADAIRYAWLYIHGGLYLDCDFELLAPLDELFTEDYDLFLVESSNATGIITNGFMAAKPKQEIFLDMIEEMKKPIGISAIEYHLHVMSSTGPLAFNRVITRTKPQYKLLEREKINPYTICDSIYCNKRALLRPLPGSSWVSTTGKVYQWCWCHNTFVIILVIILIVSILLLTLGKM